MDGLNFKSTKELKIPKKVIEQVIGQEEAVEITKKAALQRRHLLLIGEPGTGKSMIGLGLAELLPKEKLVDILSFPNFNDENQPLIRTVPAGKGREIALKARLQGSDSMKNQTIVLFIVALIVSFLPYYMWQNKAISDIIFAASMITGMVFIIGFMLFLNFARRMEPRVAPPKVIVDNYENKQAPFLDATGAHAGALLGDVLHDPFQCFIYSNIYVSESINKPLVLQPMQKIVDRLLTKHNNEILKNELGYEAIFLPKDELFVLGETNNSLVPVQVLSCNRQDYNKKMLKITMHDGRELILTPEHKLAKWQENNIVYVEAKNLLEGEEIVSKDKDIIINEQDIINTYDEKQKEQCKLYYTYLEIKQNNPGWGYKRIATSMNQPIGKTRWWHAKKHIPVPIQTTNWLKEKGLLPLKINNPKLSLLAKITGATFGDGGIFENLNGIFLSSSEKEAVEEFGKDIEILFGLKLSENSRIIEGGEYGHSWCYQNTNRNIIRFFLALGAPKGNKTKIALETPNWIYLNKIFKKEFYGSFLGSELGAPKVHIEKNRLQTLDVGITGPKELEMNRLTFFEDLRTYLKEEGIVSTSLIIRKTDNEKLLLYRLLLSVTFDNVVNFIKVIKLNYCIHKKQKIITAINEFRDLKKIKYEQLISRGYGAERIMKILHLTPKSLFIILNSEEIEA